MTKNTQRNKDKILKLLEENPILLRACKKAGVARSTVYRWQRDDLDFSDAIRYSQEVGQDNIADYAESKLLENVQNNQQKAIEFFLRHNSPKYASNKVEMQYSEKRTNGRLEFLPAGVDQAHLSGELAILEEMRRRKEIDDMVDNILGPARAPDEPIDVEKFNPYLTQAIYKRFPGTKEEFARQIADYRKSKGGDAES